MEGHMNIHGIGKIARHDILVFARTFLNAFSRTSDRIILAAASPLAIAILWRGASAARQSQPGWKPEILSLLTMAIALTAVMATRSRIKWHRDNGILAPIALRKEAMIIYGALSLVLLFAPLLCITGFSSKAILALFFGLIAALVEIGLAGIVLAKASPLGRKVFATIQNRRRLHLNGSRTTRTFDVIAGTTFIPALGFKQHIIWLSIFSMALAFLFSIMLHFNIDKASSLFTIYLIFLFIIVAAFLRLPHYTPKFFLMIGISPFHISMTFTAFAIALLAPCSILLALLSGWQDALSIGMIFGIAIAAVGLLSVIQVAHYSLRLRQAANTAIQFEIAVLAVAGFVLGPATVLLAVARVALLHNSIQRRKLLLT